MPDDDKRARIVEAALAEFVARGFEAASTNAIARRAGVAKGLPFHYWGSKEGLYVTVYEAVIERTIAAMTQEPPAAADLFERLHELGLRKLRAFQADPLAFQFVAMAAQDAPPGVREALQRLRETLLTRHWPHMLAGIDASRLRPGLTLADALETLTALGEGLERRLQPRLAAGRRDDPESLIALSAEVWRHYERLRDGLYAPPPPPTPRRRRPTRSPGRRRRRRPLTGAPRACARRPGPAPPGSCRPPRRTARARWPRRSCGRSSSPG
jgi:TetR/AcrR family transcriptional regulator